MVLGAGATRGALSGTRSPRVSPPLNRDYFDILSKFVQTREGRKYATSYDRLMKFVNIEIGRKAVASSTMEEVFNVLFMSKDLPEIFHKGRGRRRASGYRQEVKDFLSLLIKVFRFIQSKSRPRDNLYHHHILANSLSPGDVIMTLNYDTLMDNALVSAGWNPSHGYGFHAKARCEIVRPRKTNPQLSSVLLLKPHGSFNWFAKGRFKNLESLLEKRPVSKILVSKLPRLYESNQKKLVRFFIPPLYTKFFKNPFWSNLWIKTYKAAKNADRIIIVGCSLIATDYHLRAILSKSISDKRKKYREIVIVDRSQDVQKVLKSFFRGHSATGCKVYSSFSDFCRYVKTWTNTILRDESWE